MSDLVVNYNQRARELDAAKAELRRLGCILRDVADHLERRPIETCFANFEGENGKLNLFPGCKSFDAQAFPDPSELQIALEHYRACHDRLIEAQAKFPASARDEMVFPAG